MVIKIFNWLTYLLRTWKCDYFVCHYCWSSGTTLGLDDCHLTVIPSALPPQLPRTGTTGAGRTSCCAQTAASISRSTASCPPLRSQWTRRHLCSNLSKRKRMDSVGSIAWGPDGTEARYEHADLLPSWAATLSLVNKLCLTSTSPPIHHGFQYTVADVNAT